MSGVPSDDASEGLSSAPARKRAIERYVRERIGATDLDIAHIVRRFGLSRPTLQSLFRDDGGFATYVRERRLRCAFASLARRDDAARPRVSDVAYAHGYSDTSTFSRAFSAPLRGQRMRCGGPPDRSVEGGRGRDARWPPVA